MGTFPVLYMYVHCGIKCMLSPVVYVSVYQNQCMLSPVYVVTSVLTEAVMLQIDKNTQFH